MSLAIEVDDVVAVLLRDGWHAVADDSFEIDSYEFLHGDVVRVGGGVVQGVSATGARWKEQSGEWVACPFPQIFAVRCKQKEKEVN
jgi:hypothetical protein